MAVRCLAAATLVPPVGAGAARIDPAPGVVTRRVESVARSRVPVDVSVRADQEDAGPGLPVTMFFAISLSAGNIDAGRSVPRDRIPLESVAVAGPADAGVSVARHDVPRDA